MKFTRTTIDGAVLIDLEAHFDERGFFARVVSQDEFAAEGLNASFVQSSVSWNSQSAVLRGLHYQALPHGEEKLVRVTQGVVFDVIVDLRAESPSFGCWFGVELSAENRRQLYIPKGVAHGFQTLAPGTEVLDQMTTPFVPDAARGIRWDDPEIAIEWPEAPSRIVSDRDKALPLLRDTI